VFDKKGADNFLCLISDRNVDKAGQPTGKNLVEVFSRNALAKQDILSQPTITKGPASSLTSSSMGFSAASHEGQLAQMQRAHELAPTQALGHYEHSKQAPRRHTNRGTSGVVLLFYYKSRYTAGGSAEVVPSLCVVGLTLSQVAARARVLVYEVLDRGAQAVAHGAARCASQVLGHGAQADARGTAQVRGRGVQAVARGADR
jgi:hypothetical protein